MPQEGILRVLLAQVGWVLQERQQQASSSPAAGVAAAVLGAILRRDRIASHEYFRCDSTGRPPCV